MAPRRNWLIKLELEDQEDARWIDEYWSGPADSWEDEQYEAVPLELEISFSLDYLLEELD